MNLKLGKLIPVIDKRTIPIMSIFRDKKLPPFPAIFTGPDYPLQMWGNDNYGDCVMCGAANYIIRAEMFEQKIVIPITEKEVIHEYLWLSKGIDSGLVMLDVAKFWRKVGLFLAGHQYKNFAFATIKDDPDHIKAVVSLIGDAWCGFSMPENWQAAVNNKKPWIDTSLPSDPYSGHCMVVGRYDSDWVWVKTWGQWMQMSWKWFLKYTDERYAIIDSPDRWVKNSPVDVVRLKELLREVLA